MNHRNLVIGNESINGELLAHKLHQDIDFLSDRIAYLKRQTDPNPQTLKVYHDMLTSRQAVLDWLGQDCCAATG